MAEKRNRTSGPETMQTVTATAQWKERMASARGLIEDDWGQQDVIVEVIKILPSIDSLIYKTRWHNAWNKRAADPEITLAVEAAAQILIKRKKETRKRLSRQRMRRPSTSAL